MATRISKDQRTGKRPPIKPDSKARDNRLADLLAKGVRAKQANTLDRLSKADRRLVADALDAWVAEPGVYSLETLAEELAKLTGAPITRNILKLAASRRDSLRN